MNNSKVLLLGYGYTLSYLAKLLNREEVVVTTTSSQKRELLLAENLSAYQLDFSGGGSYRGCDTLSKILEAHPTIEAIVDSVPPIILKDDNETRGSEIIGSIGTTSVSEVCKAISISHSKPNSAKIKKVIYLSTTGVYGRTNGEWVDENTLPHPTQNRSVARLNSENFYSSYCPDKDINFTAVRIAAIYGEDRGLIQSIARGAYRLIAEDRWSNRIRVEDLASLIKALLDCDPNTQPVRVCASDSQPSLSKEVTDYICQKYNLPYPQVIPLEQAIKTGDMFATSNQRVRNDLMRKLLGRELQFPSYREGF